MKPADLRNATFDKVCDDLQGRLLEVYRAWCEHGPATTRDLATWSGISILNVRPRTTDLFTLGLVELVGDRRGQEGIYRARAKDDWQIWLASTHPKTESQPILI